MLYSIRHATVYEYDRDVSLSHHLLRLAPRALDRQRCLEQIIESVPPASTQSHHLDHFGNTGTFLTIEGPHRRLEIISKSLVDSQPPSSSPEPDGTPEWEVVRDLCSADGLEAPLEAVEFVFPSTSIPQRPEFAAYAEPSFPPGRPVLDAALDLCRRIHADFAFDSRATTVMTPVLEFFEERRGVCQDFAHLMVGCLRSLGLPARYVSGYLETLPPRGRKKLVGADASHAWVSIWCGDAGWIDLDPTNNVMPSNRHFTVAWGRDYDDVSPVRGVLIGSGSHQLSVSVDVSARDAANPL
ncbi:MAG: hypothetical protein QOF48_1022 [Verrucomicrobiota bacterium]|jgi:transglutaminase-like putative cysteine protease